MYKKQIGSLVFIFICTTMAWLLLSVTTTLRTDQQNSKLKQEVGQLWGKIQKQKAPRLVILQQIREEVLREIDGKQVSQMEDKIESVPLVIDSSTVDVGLQLDQRQKGLLWYSTYRADFNGTYVIRNSSAQRGEYIFSYEFPVKDGLYDNFSCAVDGDKLEDLNLTTGRVSRHLTLEPGERRAVTISYRTQGLDEWWYVFGEGVSQIRDFQLTMMTDFDKIDFPENSISPVNKRRVGDGWSLTWQYDNLISGIQIGIKMPQRLNPGPFVSRLSLFAPVSLFFFFFIMFIITTVKRMRIHAMNYFFIAASFFAYHLLLAYLVDHINIHLAVAIGSVVSILLVITYMRLVVGLRFALVETGVSQFVYLLLFSYAFFIEGYTGLTITILSIITLFVVMQSTARFNWDLSGQVAEQKLR